MNEKIQFDETFLVPRESQEDALVWLMRVLPAYATDEGLALQEKYGFPQQLEKQPGWIVKFDKTQIRSMLQEIEVFMNSILQTIISDLWFGSNPHTGRWGWFRLEPL